MRLISGLSFLVSGTAAVSPLVKLDYSSYQGVALGNQVTQWLGMRYAASPVGKLRFAAPHDPPSQYGVQQADKHGPICIGTGSGPPTKDMNEDCLVLEVYAPSNATADSKLPVYFVSHDPGIATHCM